MTVGDLWARVEKWWRARNQTTWIYCPTCKDELIASGSWILQNVDGLEEFKCIRCGAMDSTRSM